MNENLRGGIADAILANFNPPDDKHSSWWFNEDRTVDAVLAVVGPELDRLRAQVERLRANRPVSRDAWRRMKAYRDEALERTGRVEALHRADSDGSCRGCWEAGGMDGAPLWPCPTIQALASVPEPSDSEPVGPCRLCGARDAEPVQTSTGFCNHDSEPAPAADRRPHSRACGIKRHDHGPDCHRNCPTCGGAS